MRKRIIVCCDGTNNDLRSDGTMWSNVGRIAECISEYSSKDKTTKQVVGYLSGIGTEGGSWLRMKNQATGYGLDEKILAAYGFICNYYDKGDSIVLIGFSRGAFIARCVVAFIADVGVLYKTPLRGKTVEDIYTEWTQLMTPGPENAKRRELLFVKYNSSSNARRVVDALALWDTVSSLHHSPPKTYLDPVKTQPPWNVKYAFHALALEEHRGLFKPDVWTGDYPAGVKVLKQCWFRGVHSHVGGSNEQWSNNLTNVSLSWIIAQLKENGLVSFDKDQLKRVFASDGTAKTTFQSRKDVGMKDSDNALWKFLAFGAGEKAALRTPGNGTNEFLHWSVVSQPSQLLQPVPPMKLKIPMGSLLPTERATESEREAVRWPELYFYYTEDCQMTPEEANGRLAVNHREIFDIERPDETNRRYLPLIRGKRYCNAMSPPPPQNSGDDSEGRFHVIDDTVEMESQPQASVEPYTMTGPTNEEILRPSVNGVLRPAAYGSYGTSSTSHATASNTYEATSDRTTSVPYTSSISADMPTEQDGYRKSQDYQNGYKRGYDEGYKSGYQKGLGAPQSSTVYNDTYNKDYSISSYGNYIHEVANAETQDYPYRGSGHVSTLATDESSYDQGDGTHDVYNTANTETRSTIVQDDDSYWQENKLERHGRSRKKSSRQ
ncbi:unnamed protein product [Fusarium graminearum]|nr:unnamed protein product [Fusarium graminearum]